MGVSSMVHEWKSQGVTDHEKKEDTPFNDYSYASKSA